MPVLKIHELRKEFGPLVAVKDVNFSIETGQVMGLIGPNGAGKTTLLRMLATILPPTDGSAEILGCDLRRRPLDIRKRIGYLPDFFNLYNDLTLWECLDFFARSYGIPENQIPSQIQRSLEYVGLVDKKHTLFRHLSRGMVQRMGLAVLLVHDPDLYLLDEPASGLDPAARIQLRNILKQLSSEGKTILISSHILTELSGFCSHIAMMNRGEILRCGSVEEIQRQLTQTRKLNLVVLDDPQKAVSLIRSFSEVTFEHCRDQSIMVTMQKGPETIADLNAFLVSNGIRIIELREEKTDLEDLFMAVSSQEKKPNSSLRTGL